jgi:hypothetical protein
MANGSFSDGYIAGYRSVRPGIVPDIPAHSIPAGKSDYDWGFEQGKKRALGG